MKKLFTLLLVAISASSALAAKQLEEKTIFVKAVLKIRGQVITTGMNLEQNQSGSVENPNFRLVVTPVVREGKVIEVAAQILEKVDGGFRRVSSPKIYSQLGQPASITERGRSGYELSVESNVD